MSGKICLWLLIFVSFYYPIGAFFILTLNVPSTPVNILIKGSCAAVALYLIIVWVLNSKQKLSLKTPIWFIFVWWIGYTIRILYDLQIADVHFGSKPDSLIYGYTFGNILLPITAGVLWYKHINIKEVAPLAYKFFALANILVFIILIQQNGGFNVGLFLNRAAAMAENADKDELILNPIAIGFYGSLLTITSLYYLIIIKKARLWIYLPFFLFGILMVVLGASRGPFISTICTMLIIVFYRFRISYSKIITFLKIILIIIVTGGVLTVSIGSKFSLEDFSMFNRLSKMVDDRKKDRKEVRDYAWAGAWQDFLDSPIVGKQFVGTYDNFYPHNIVLEIPMATGTIGSFFFLGFLIPAFVKIYRSFWHRDHDYFFISIIYCPILVATLFSGSLFMTIHFWMILLLLIAFDVKPKARLVHVRASKRVTQNYQTNIHELNFDR